MRLFRLWFVGMLLLTSVAGCGQQSSSGKRKIIIDQDAAGPGGTDQQSILLLIQSPQTEVLGITVVTGDAWLKEEVAHTLRMLEIIGRTDIPVVPGAEYPLVRRKDETELWEQQYGAVPWVGAWTPRFYHPPDQLGDMPEGKPTTKPLDEDAAHFLVRMVHKYPHEITIYAGGPMTNLALAITIDPEFPILAKELVLHGRQSESAHRRSRIREHSAPRIQPLVRSGSRAYRAHCTMEEDRLHDCRYLGKDTHDSRPDQPRESWQDSCRGIFGGACSSIWKLQLSLGRTCRTAWLDPTLITTKDMRYLDIDLNRGAGYGNMLSWTEQDKPKIVGPPAEIQVDLDKEKFYKMFVDLLTAPTPKP